jgi:predicted enzyme related to lactoylglutathione lyase
VLNTVNVRDWQAAPLELWKETGVAPSLGRLAYLYIGAADFERDTAYYEQALGAERVWAFHAFGAKVAAFRVCEGPVVLLADHRPAPSCMPVLAVGDLDATVAALKARGWQSDGEPFEIPNGPCVCFVDPSGNRDALFQNDRPDAMERAYADQGNPRALRG